MVLPWTVSAANPVVTVHDIDVYKNGYETTLVIRVNRIPESLEVGGHTSPSMTTLSFLGHRQSGPQKETLRFDDSPSNLQQIYMEERPGPQPKFQVFIKRLIPNSVRVDVDRTGNLIIARIDERLNTQGNIRALRNGVGYGRKIKRMAQGEMIINVLTVDPRNPDVDVFPALPQNTMKGLDEAEDVAQRYQAVAAVNASFFKPDHQIPLGTVIIDGELISGPIFHRVAFGITKDNQLLMDKLELRGEVVLPNNTGYSGQILPIANVNQPRVNLNEAVIYTRHWGTKAPAVPKNGFQAQVVDEKLVAISHSRPMDIPESGYVISGPEHILRPLLWYPKQQPLQLRVYTVPDWSNVKHAVGGGPYLVRNGRSYIDMSAQRFSLGNLRNYAPRTAIGRTRDGNMIIVTANGLKNVDTGPSLSEMASLMMSLGAVDAMNLDGGGSTQMVVEGERVHRLNQHSFIRPVSTCLLIRSREDQAPIAKGRIADAQSTRLQSAPVGY